MGATQSPWTYSEAGHPFDGLPLRMVQQVGRDGDGGMYELFDHFTNFQAPTAEAITGGVLLTGTTGTTTWLAPAQASGIVTSSVRMETSATAGSNGMMEWRGMPMRYVVGQRMWMFARIALSNADIAAAFIGLCTTNVDFIAGFPADGIYLDCIGTATDFDFSVSQDSGITTNTLDLGLTLADDTFVTVGFAVNTAGVVTPYSISDAGVVTAGTAIASTDTNMPDAAADILTPHIGVESSDGGGDYIDIDWVLVARERQ